MSRKFKMLALLGLLVGASAPLVGSANASVTASTEAYEEYDDFFECLKFCQGSCTYAGRCYTEEK